jgi:hypothetical protein
LWINVKLHTLVNITVKNHGKIASVLFLISTYTRLYTIKKIDVHQGMVKVYVNTVNVSHDIVYMSMYMEMSLKACVDIVSVPHLA